MAEIVGLHIENMIPELEQMKRLNLFKPEEIQDIVKKRKEFEYKTERTMKEKQDFLRYINYEVKLLREIKLRRDKLGISEKKSEIEYSVAKRVVKLYQISLSYFKSDVRMWVSYINFCTQTRFSNLVSQAFKQMLQVHSDKKHLWLYAAKWELCESENMEGALNYLKTGLHHHPDSKELYTEAFRLELKVGEKYSGEKTDNESESKQEKSVRRAGVHFKVAVGTIGNDVEFIISLLNIATEFKFTESLQKEIIEHLTLNCWKSELMWHTMAQRELNGHKYNTEEVNKSTAQLCIAVYKSAIKVLPTIAMWEKYLDTLIEISRDEKRKKKPTKATLDNIFQEAYDGGFLLEQHYLVWLEILVDDPKYEDVLVKATEAMPKSVELWLTRLRYFITKDDEPNFQIVFKAAVKALGSSSLEIYRTAIKYYQLRTGINSCGPEVKAVFEQGILRPEPEISMPLRPQFIEWLSIARSIKCSRLAYDRIATKPPFCHELHKKMVEIEIARFTPNIERIRIIHKIACQQFGKEKTDVWMDRIKFELEHGDPKFVPEIYNNAKNILNENLVSIFTTDYAILKTQ